MAKAEGELTQALGRFFALSEAYPQLKATENVKQLQEELTSTENKIGFARQLYNDVATQYNTKQMQFPTNLVAGLAEAQPAELWEIEDAGERAVPNVDLSGPSRRRDGAQPLSAAGVQSPAHHLAGRRSSSSSSPGSASAATWRSTSRRPRAPPGGLPPRHPLHRDRRHPGGRRDLLVLVDERRRPGALGHRRLGNRRADRARMSSGW